MHPSLCLLVKYKCRSGCTWLEFSGASLKKCCKAVLMSTSCGKFQSQDFIAGTNSFRQEKCNRCCYKENLEFLFSLFALFFLEANQPCCFFFYFAAAQFHASWTENSICGALWFIIVMWQPSVKHLHTCCVFYVFVVYCPYQGTASRFGTWWTGLALPNPRGVLVLSRVPFPLTAGAWIQCRAQIVYAPT